VFVIVIGAAFYLMPQNQAVIVTNETPVSATPSDTQSNPTGEVATTTPVQNGYTLAEVTTHNSASSCWAAINGNVYDLTAWINQHPGGPDMILSICGTDGSVAFNGQHSGDRQAANELKNFLLGPLAS